MFNKKSPRPQVRFMFDGVIGGMEMNDSLYIKEAIYEW